MEYQSYVYKNTNHVANLNDMRLSGKLCDVTIKVNEKGIQAHKIILAANLKYFETMFSNPFQESKQDVVTMKDIEETDMEAFITYAYTGEILLTDNNALNLLEVANYLTEDSIKQACIDFLKIHLKKEDACQAYKLANAIDSTSLKSVAIQTILSNFEDCSQTTDYFDFDIESLKDILSYPSLDFIKSQQVFFEGVERWIFHEAESRRVYVSDLLDFIEITKLKADYLLQYFCKRIEDHDYSDIVKDIVSFYNRKTQEIHQAWNVKKCLIVAAKHCDYYHVQLYDFEEKAWCQLYEISDMYISWFGPATILNGRFYYIVGPYNAAYFQSFNPETKQSTMLASVNSSLSSSAMCAYGRFLYFCGGVNSDQVLGYNPHTNSFETLHPMKMRRAGAFAIFYQDRLHVLGGSDNGFKLNSVEIYEPVGKKWIAFPSMCEKRLGHAVAVLEGKLYACGGVETKSVEVYDPAKYSWQLVASMNKRRNRFVVIAHEGKLLAIGGNPDKTIEVYDPRENQWKIDEGMSTGLNVDYLRGGLMPYSHIPDADEDFT